MVLARLYEEETSRGPLYTRILKECILGQGDNAREPSQGKKETNQKNDCKLLQDSSYVTDGSPK